MRATKKSRARSLLRLFQEYILARWLVVLMAFSLISGVYYYYFGSGNWNAAQIALGAHLAVGSLSIFLFVAYVKQHLPWGLRVAKPGPFRKLAWALLSLYGLVLLSGLINAMPFFLYLLDVIWFPDFQTFDLVATVHLIAALALPVFVFAHLLMHIPAHLSEPSDVAEYLDRTALSAEELSS